MGRCYNLSMTKEYAAFILSLFFLPITVLSAEEIKLLGDTTIEARIDVGIKYPIAKEETSISIKILDKSRLFSLKRCDCRLRITDASGKEILNYPLEQQENYIAEKIKDIKLTFPQKGKYALEVSGSSTNKVFPSFLLSNTIEIKDEKISEGEKQLERTKQWLVDQVLPFVIVIIILAIGYQFILKRK